MISQLIKLFKFSFHWPRLHWLEVIFLNYYWVLVFGALLNIFFRITWFADTFFPFLIYVLVILNHKRIKCNIFDILWILYFLIVLLSWTVNAYPYKSILIIRCLSEQFAYSLCYWIVRQKPTLSANNIIRCSYFPLFITALIGIYCYFTNPPWYAAMTRTGKTAFDALQFLRLRSIFPDSYIITYFLGIAIVYLLVQFITGKELPKRISYIFFLIFTIALFLSLTRSVIVAVIVAAMVVIYYAVKHNMTKTVRPLIVSLLFLVIGGGFFVINLDGYEKDFYLQKINSLSNSNDNSDSVMGRLFMNKKSNYGLLGDGVGRHNLYADKYVPDSIMPDGEYNKMITEQGFIGFFLFIIIIIAASVKCFRNLPYMLFELIMVIFLLLVMIAANPLSTGDKHSIIYWLILGQIANYKVKDQFL